MLVYSWFSCSFSSVLLKLTVEIARGMLLLLLFLLFLLLKRIHKSQQMFAVATRRWCVHALAARAEMFNRTVLCIRAAIGSGASVDGHQQEHRPACAPWPRKSSVFFARCLPAMRLAVVDTSYGRARCAQQCQASRWCASPMTSTAVRRRSLNTRSRATRQASSSCRARCRRCVLRSACYRTNIMQAYAQEAVSDPCAEVSGAEPANRAGAEDRRGAALMTETSVKATVSARCPTCLATRRWSGRCRTTSSASAAAVRRRRQGDCGEVSGDIVGRRYRERVSPIRRGLPSRSVTVRGDRSAGCARSPMSVDRCRRCQLGGPLVQARGRPMRSARRSSWQLTAQGKLPAAHKGLVHWRRYGWDRAGRDQDETLRARGKADLKASAGAGARTCARSRMRWNRRCRCQHKRPSWPALSRPPVAARRHHPATLAAGNRGLADHCAG